MSGRHLQWSEHLRRRHVVQRAGVHAEDRRLHRLRPVDGTACDDGEPMTSVDTCQHGSCAGFPPVTTTTLCPAASTTSSTTTTAPATTTTTLPTAACAVDRSDEAAALSSLVVPLQNRLASIENHARRRAHRQGISAECSDALSEILSNAGTALGEVSPSQ